ncbi:uncharacterized protein LOC124161143 [Ischnura elegans]|uniref:uncharacterized protein LOC124161143 n=1 Tax=Ischnura elegans TaxID=197161 RepID=UPI001ED8AB9B|nr:uncharacterized protein LOC124161143 [Ischnura elegans]
MGRRVFSGYIRTLRSKHKLSADVESRTYSPSLTLTPNNLIIMKVLAVLLVAVCAASAAAVENVKVERHGGNFAYSVEQGVVPHHSYVPSPYVAQPYVAQPYVAQPYVAQPYVAPVVAKVADGKPVVSTYAAGAYPYPVGAYPYAYGYPYAHAPVPYAGYPYGSPYHTVPVVPKVEKVE